MYWTDNNNTRYGPFSMQPDGFPNAGQVIRHFRRLRKISANRLAELLGGDISDRWLQVMEKENMFNDINRRQAIARLLAIPPILLGLGDIHDLLPMQDITGNKTDIQVLDDRLDFLYEAFNAGVNPHYIRPQLNSAIDILSTDRQKDALVLLSKYYRAYSRIERDMQNMQVATKYIKHAEGIARELDDYELYSIALHSHGYILEEQGKTREAMVYFQQGHSLVKDDITPLAGCSYIDVALVSSQLTQDNKDKKTVEERIDRAEVIADKTPNEYEKDGKLNNEVIHTNRASVYVNMGMLESATEEIDKAISFILPTQVRRNTRLDIIQAKHAFLTGDIMICLASLERAYAGSKDLNSKHNLMKIHALATSIYKSRYGTMQEVQQSLNTILTP